MRNAYVTTGLATQKRPGLVKVATLEAGTKGLSAALGKLQTFYSSGTVTHANPLFNANNAAFGGYAIHSVPYADVFNGFVYASVEYDFFVTPTRRITQHHYFDGNIDGSPVTSSRCPQTPAVLKTASRLYAISDDGSSVRFCALNNPRNWNFAVDEPTLPNPGGFLATGLNATGDRSTKALGLYQKKLVALSSDSAQVWNVDPDETANALEDIVENVGTKHPGSLATVGGDLVFLSDFGFRSITTNRILDKREDVDVGSPIDPIVKSSLASMTGLPLAKYYYGSGQYLCAIDQTLYVYSISRTSKIAAWSRYLLPFSVDNIAELGGVLYLRSGDNVYKFDENVQTDDGAEYEVLIEMPYMDFKTPGTLKRVYAIDIVMEGECFFSLGWDVRNPAAITSEVRVIGNTRGGGLISIECCGTEFSPRFRNANNQPFRLDALSIHYDNLGTI